MKNKMNGISKYRISYLIIGVLLVTGLFSCTPASNDSKQVPRLPAQQQNNVQNSNATSESPSSATVEKTEQTQNEDNQEVKLNPPHGQPGHRCEIPVGAPLNSPAANSVQQPATVETAAPAPTIRNNSMAPTIENANRINPSQTRSTAAPATGTKPANNPPHGQPWHRCDIAVGSPLP